MDRPLTAYRITGSKHSRLFSCFFRLFCLICLLFATAPHHGVSTRTAWAEEASPPPQDVDGDLVPDLDEMAPSYLSWGPNTSGPMFTGTAEVDPV